MSDIDNNVYDDFEETPEPEPTEPSRPPSNNRNFLIAAGVLGGLFILGLIALVLYGVFFAGNRGVAAQETAAFINAQNTATSIAATEIARAQAQAMTPSLTPTATDTQAPTPTPVVVFATETPVATDTPEGGDPTALANTAVAETAFAAETSVALGTTTLEVGGLLLDDVSRTQTVAALLTQAAGGATAVPGGLTPTVLPTTGFADQVGLPGMLLATVLLVGVIFVVRRLRTAAH